MEDAFRKMPKSKKAKQRTAKQNQIKIAGTPGLLYNEYKRLPVQEKA